MSDDWTISASKIKKFERCEEAFRLAYIEGHDEMGPESRHLRRGNAVHEAIEDVLEDQIGSAPDVGSDLLKAAYSRNGGQEGYRLSDEFHGHVLGCLETAARFIRNHVDEIREVEMEVEYGVKQPTITRDFGGYMDLASEDAVIDWKTGKSENKESGEIIQGAIYMAGYAHEFGEPPEEIIFAYLNPEAGDDHPKMRSIEPSDEIWETLIGKARRLLVSIENNDYTATTDESKCHWCDYEVWCSASPVGAGSIDWESYP